METTRRLSVRRRLAASPEHVYAAVSDLKRMASWSDEYLGAWRFWRGEPHSGVRFVGWNRNGWRVWFTTCRIVIADRPRQFAFESGFLGMPIARWSYGISGTADGTCDVVESWDDLRGGGPIGAFTRWLGTVFTGTTPEQRVRRNEAGMQTTLRRLATELECVPRAPQPPE
jgi:Polyketide cyclase / dehydrase and lipid transport